jgi:hypothetical protein
MWDPRAPPLRGPLGPVRLPRASFGRPPGPVGEPRRTQGPRWPPVRRYEAEGLQGVSSARGEGGGATPRTAAMNGALNPVPAEDQTL